jgi:hypothetical protein
VRLAALVHDPALTEERELLDVVSAAAGIAVLNGRLQAELRARLEELRGSRQRVVEAGQAERKRLERNLHDGAQQRLVALSLDLRMLEKRIGDDPDARALVDKAREEIALSLGELRGIAHGLNPAVVTGHGLAVALESLVAVAPLPVQLKVDLDERVEEPVEVAAYYVVSERLANSASTRTRPARPSRLPAATASWWSRWWTTASVAPTRRRAAASAAWPIASRRWTDGCGSGLRAAAALGCGRSCHASSDRGGQRASARGGCPPRGGRRVRGRRAVRRRE